MPPKPGCTFATMLGFIRFVGKNVSNILHTVEYPFFLAQAALARSSDGQQMSVACEKTALVSRLVVLQ